MEIVKPAATIMLARENEGTLEVLLLRRNKALAFAAGLWVFPGGKIEVSEIEQGKDKLEAARLAAVRETKEEANIDIHKDELIFFSHWTTPVVEPRRYATWFFFGGIHHDFSTVQIDDSEIKAHIWLSPEQALAGFKKGKIPMMPPTIMSLQLISKCKTIAEAKQLLLQNEPLFILPILYRAKGKMICIYEGDASYTSGNADTIGARHRLTLDLRRRILF